MSRKPDEWMPLHIGDYFKDTPRLTRDQHGGYLLLLLAYWTNGGPLPDDDGELAAAARATPLEWRRKLKPILSRFFTIKDGLWHQKRADEELAKARKLMAAKSAAGKKGAAAKWQADGKPHDTGMADASPSHKQDDDGTDDKPMDHLPSTLVTTVPSEELKFLNGSGKKKEVGEKKTTIKDPDERIARFQAKIAKQIGAEGWDTVVASTETWRDDYAEALAKCQAACDELGKEWPSNWPAKDMPDFLDAAKRRHA